MAWFSPKPLLIPDIIALNAMSLNSKDAVVCDGKSISWSEFGLGTARTANALLSSGLEHGDRVVVLMSNSYEMVEAMFGVIRAGLVAVPLNVAINDAAVVSMIHNSGAKAIIASTEHTTRLDGQREQIAHTIESRFICFGQSGDGWIDYEKYRNAASPALPVIEITPDDVCNIIYSSGTTGEPKGIVHDHACREAWGSDMAVALRYHSGARTLCTLGLYSNISWVAMLATFFVGGTLIVHRRFDPIECLTGIEREKITHTVVVPLQLQRLLERDDFESFDLSSLDTFMCCGSPLALGLKRKVIEQIPGDLIELYGLTEGLVTVLTPEVSLSKIETVGRACPGQHLAIIDEDNQIVSAGRAGEIVGTSRFLMAGYYLNDAANDDATWLHSSGERWLRTGDIGKFDDEGFLTLVDRKKDMILSGGQNVYPADIESILIAHAAVSEVAVVGVTSKKWGETPLAVVVATADAKSTASEITQWANSKLGKQQRIAATVFVDELRRNPNGKILKRQLRDTFADAQYD